MTQPLITKYRPAEWEEVIGHATAVNALLDSIMGNTPHTYLFSGPPGIAKTTMARLLGKTIDANVIEINIAANNGIDHAKELVEMANYNPVYASGRTLWILDEAHTFTKQAQQTLLKLFEEPPEFLYIALCTTEPTKIIPAIVDRCYHTKLQPLTVNQIRELLDTVCELESWTVNEEVLQGIIVAAAGLPRRALTILQSGHACASALELSDIIVGVDIETSPAIELAKFLVKGGKDWGRVQEMLAAIDDEEEAFASMSRWLATAVTKCKKEGEAKQVWKILDALTFPRETWDRRAQLVVTIGALLWTE